MPTRTKRPTGKPEPRKRGRRFILRDRPHLTGEIVKLITEAHATLEVCAKACGITATTILNWQARGRDIRERIDQLDPDDQPAAIAELTTDDTLLLDFFDRLTRARGQAETALITSIAGDKDWRARAWVLEFVYHYHRVQVTEHTGAGGGPIQVDVEELRERGRKAIDELAEKREQQEEAKRKREARRGAV